MRLGLYCAAILVATAAGGCGSSTVYPVKGKVLYDGKPMKGGGSISLIPTKNQAGKAAGGVIGEDGTYELTTNKPGDGSMPGEFRVVIHQTVEREPEATKDGEKVGKSTLTVAMGDRIPAIYSDPMKSPLVLKVEAKANEVNLELSSDAGGAPVPPGGAMLRNPLRDTFAKLNRDALRPFDE